jgi:hypothetical protein
MALWPAAPPVSAASQFDRELMKHMQDAIMYGMSPSQAINSHILGTTAKKMEPDYSTNKLLELIHMRMHRERLAPGTQIVPDFSFIAPYKNGDTVVVFLVHDKKPTYIEDDWGLFPSDALITKLRLLLG